MRVESSERGFTLIEMLVVIGIIITVMALALPNFIALMRQQKWQAAVANIQHMIWRARTLATNERKDFSVEFDLQGDKGTWLWLESEMNDLERLPDLAYLQERMGSQHSFRIWILDKVWFPSGGTCRSEGGKYVDFQINYADSDPDRSGDNARQSEVVELGHGLTVDPAPGRSENFLNWDAPGSVAHYGQDNWPDLRIGTNGCLTQPVEPVICIREKRGTDTMRIGIGRVTGRTVRMD